MSLSEGELSDFACGYTEAWCSGDHRASQITTLGKGRSRSTAAPGRDAITEAAQGLHGRLVNNVTREERAITSNVSLTVAPRTARQRVVDTYVRAYSAGDYEAAVAIFTEDVRWIVVGAFDITGRDAYLANMTNEHVSGHPDIRRHALLRGGRLRGRGRNRPSIARVWRRDWRWVPRRVRVPWRSGL